MYEYICFTNKGKFKFLADDDFDAMRRALWFCWRDGLDFERIEFRKSGENYTLSILYTNNKSHECFTL